MCNYGAGHSDLELSGMGSSRKYHELCFCGVKPESSEINPVNNDVDIIGTQAGKLVEEGGRQLLLYKLRARSKSVAHGACVKSALYQ